MKATLHDLIRLKSFTADRDVYDVAYDAARSFSMVDDMVDIYQLARQQKYDSSSRNKLKNVTIFAEEPIELIGHGESSVQQQISELRETVANNLKNDVTYTYFSSSIFPEKKLKEFFVEHAIPESISRRNVEVVKLPRSLFKTFFTVHNFQSTTDVYMSLITEDRDDLLIKLKQRHGRNVCSILDTLRGQVNEDGLFKVRDFVSVY